MTNHKLQLTNNKLQITNPNYKITYRHVALWRPRVEKLVAARNRLNIARLELRLIRLGRIARLFAVANRANALGVGRLLAVGRVARRRNTDLRSGFVIFEEE